MLRVPAPAVKSKYRVFNLSQEKEKISITELCFNTASALSSSRALAVNGYFS